MADKSLNIILAFRTAAAAAAASGITPRKGQPFWIEDDPTKMYVGDGTSTVAQLYAAGAYLGNEGVLDAAGGSAVANLPLDTAYLFRDLDGNSWGIVEANFNSPAGHFHIYVRNETGTTIPAGTCVKLTGAGGAGTGPQVVPCDNTDAAKMPPDGILETAIATGANGWMVQAGWVNVDGGFTGGTNGEPLFVQSDGTLSATPPAKGVVFQAGTARTWTGYFQGAVVDFLARQAVGVVPQSEAEAGTATTPRLWSAQRIAQAIAASVPANLTALANLTGAADRLAYFTGPGAMSLAELTSFARTLLDDTSATGARATLGLVIGTDVQAYSAKLLALANLIWAADKGVLLTGTGTVSTFDLGTFARGVIAQTTAAGWRDQIEAAPLKSTVTTKADNFTIGEGEGDTLYRCTKATAMTCTAGVTAGAEIGARWVIAQWGAGTVTVQGDGTTTIRQADGLFDTSKQYAVVYLQCVAENEFLLTGDLA